MCGAGDSRPAGQAPRLQRGRPAERGSGKSEVSPPRELGHQEAHAALSSVEVSDEWSFPRATAGRKWAGGRASPEDPTEAGPGRPESREGVVGDGPPWAPPAPSGFGADWPVGKRKPNMSQGLGVLLSDPRLGWVLRNHSILRTTPCEFGLVWAKVRLCQHLLRNLPCHGLQAERHGSGSPPGGT